MSKYRSLYDRYRSLIAEGTWAPGERLPSLRSVAEAEGLGLNTVRAAFDLLEGEGLVRFRERGGCYARGPAGKGLAAGGHGGAFSSFGAHSAPAELREIEGLSASKKVEYLLASGGASTGFALAEPDASLLPVARLERLFSSLSGSWIDYGDQSGEEILRRRITATYHHLHGGLEPEGIVVTNGATEAIGVAIRAFVEPGDAVAVESPTFYDYFRQLAAVRARIVEVPLRPGRGLDIDLLEERMNLGAGSRSRGLKMIIAQPNVQNPTGAIMPDEDKRRLVELAARHGTVLVQDDVYGDLAFALSGCGETRPANLSSYGDYERIIYVSSFSKCLAPGLRVGWIAASGLRSEIARAKSMASLATNRPAQRLIAAYLEGNAFKKHLAAMRASLASQLQAYLEVLAEVLPEEARILRPEGGCLLWIDLGAGRDASRLFEAAASKGILFAPGELFSTNPFFRGHLRINFGRRLTEAGRADLAALGAMARALPVRRSRRV
jgi:DNA-binding transcriptional MocR family regulator